MTQGKPSRLYQTCSRSLGGRFKGHTNKAPPPGYVLPPCSLLCLGEDLAQNSCIASYPSSPLYLSSSPDLVMTTVMHYVLLHYVNKAHTCKTGVCVYFVFPGSLVWIFSINMQDILGTLQFCMHYGYTITLLMLISEPSQLYAETLPPVTW